MAAAARIFIGRRAKTLPWRRKMISTTMENTVSAIITDIERFTRGRPWDDLKNDTGYNRLTLLSSNLQSVQKKIPHFLWDTE